MKFIFLTLIFFSLIGISFADNSDLYDQLEKLNISSSIENESNFNEIEKLKLKALAIAKSIPDAKWETQIYNQLTELKILSFEFGASKGYQALAFKIANTNDFIEEKGKSLFYSSVVNLLEGNVNSALIQLAQSKEIFVETENYDFLALNYLVKSEVLYLRKKDYESLEALAKANRLLDKIDEPIIKFFIQMLSSHYDFSIEKYKSSEKKIKSALNNAFLLNNKYFSILAQLQQVRILYKINRPGQAENLMKSIWIENKDYSPSVPWIYLFKGNQKLDEGKNDEALELFEDLNNLSVDYGAKVLEAYALIPLIKIAVDNDEFGKAKLLIEKAIKMSENSGFDDYLYHLKKIRIINRFKEKGAQTLVKKFNNLLNIQDSIYLASKVISLEDMIEILEFKEKDKALKVLKEKEKELLEKTEMQKKLLLLFSIGFFLFVFGAWNYYKLFQKEEANKKILQENYFELIKSNKEVVSEFEEVQKQLKSPEFLKDDTIYLTNKERTKLRLGDILYIESINNRVNFYMENGDSHSDWEKLKNYYAILPHNMFVQFHRSYIVNITKIVNKKATSITLVDNTVLNVGRKYKKPLQEAINNMI